MLIHTLWRAISRTGIASADIDGDNDLDIVVSGYNNSDPGGPGVISIRYNDGNGQFSTLQSYTTELWPQGRCAGRLK